MRQLERALAQWFAVIGSAWSNAGWPVAAAHAMRSALSGRSGMACLAATHVLVVYVLCGFFLVPPVGKAMLEGRVAASLGRPISVERIRFNPLSFDLSVEGFRMFEPGGDKVFASFDRFEVNLNPSQLVFGRVDVDGLLVQKPFVRLARDQKGRLNIADLLPGPETVKEAASAARNRTSPPAGGQADSTNEQAGQPAVASGKAPAANTPPNEASQSSETSTESQPGQAGQPAVASGKAPAANTPPNEASQSFDTSTEGQPNQAGQPAVAPDKTPEVQASRPGGQGASAQPAPPAVAQAQPRTVIFDRPGLGFRLRDVMLADGVLLFEDALTGSRQELTALHFGVKSLTSDEPGLRDLFSTGGVINKSSVQLTVQADPFGPAPEAKVRLSIKDVDLNPYAPYLKTADNLDLHLDQLGVLAGVRFPHLAQGDRSPVVDLDARLDGLQLSVEGSPTFGIESMSVHGAELDLGAPGLAVEQVEISSPTVRFVRDEDGRTTLDAIEEAVDLPGGQPKDASSPFGVKVSKVELKNGLVALTDKGLGLEASVEGLRLDLADFDLGAGSLGKLTLKGQGSHFDSVDCAVSGDFSPLDLSGDVSLDGVDLGKPGPVLRRLFPNLVLSGKARAKASFQVGEKGGSPTGKITTDLSMSDLTFSGAGADKPLMALRGLRLSGVETDLAGKAVDVGKVEIQGGAVRLLRDPGGAFALERLFASASARPAAASARSGQGGTAPQSASGAPSARTPDQSPPAGQAEAGAANQASEARTPDQSPPAVQAEAGAANQASVSGPGRDPAGGSQSGQTPETKSQAGPAAKPAARRAGKAAGGGSDAVRGSSVGPGRYGVRELAVSGLAVEYQADAGSKPAQLRLDSLGVRGAGFPLAAPVDFEAKGQAFGSGGFSLSGRVDPAGWTGSVKLGVTGLSLPDAARLVPGLPVTMAAGTLALAGELSGSLSGQTPSVRYVGDMGLGGVSVTAPGEADPLVSLADLSIKGLDCVWPSAVVKARSVSLASPSMILTLDQDGVPVLPGVSSAKSGDAKSGDSKSGDGKSVDAKSGDSKSGDGKSVDAKPAGAGAGPAKPQAAKKAPPQTRAKAQVAAEAKPQPLPQSPSALSLEIGEFSLQKGRLDLRFLGVTPPARLELSDLSVQAKPVKTSQPGQVTLTSSIGQAGRLSAEGQAGWVGGEPMLDLKARLENLDLSQFSSVSRKFTGFPIARGKLALTLDYKAGKKLFDLKNRVVVLGIQLGPKSPEPGGKDIPLDLAVSLLTDGNGVITMDIPVSGDTENLKVDLSGVISKAMAGAFAKILFSPLSFLNVARTDGRTAPVSFQPGTATLTPEGARILTELAQALAQRPRLNLELAAYVDTAEEGAAFSVRLAEGRSAQAGETGAAGQVKPGQANSGKEGTTKEKPGTDKSAAAPQPSAQAQTVMPLPDDWRRLAESRLEAARRYLVDVARLSEARVFTVASDPFKPPAIKGVSGARVDASLKY